MDKKSFEKICVLMSDGIPYIGAEAGLSALCSSLGTTSSEAEELFRGTFGMSGVDVLKALSGQFDTKTY